MSKKFCWWVVVAVLISCSRWELGEDELASPSALQVDTTQGYDGVYLIASNRRCTGTRVGQHTVLTAAHCIARLPANAPIFILGQQAQIQATQSLLLGTGTENDPRDLALLYFDNTSLPGPIYPLGRNLSLGEVVTLVGFGCNHPKKPTTGGIKRVGTNQVYRISEYVDVSTPLQSIQNLAVQNLGHRLLGPVNRAGTCFGDSGGPLLSANGELLGVSHSAITDTAFQISRFVNVTRPEVLESISPNIR